MEHVSFSFLVIVCWYDFNGWVLYQLHGHGQWRNIHWFANKICRPWWSLRLHSAEHSGRGANLWSVSISMLLPVLNLFTNAPIQFIWQKADKGPTTTTYSAVIMYPYIVVCENYSPLFCLGNQLKIALSNNSICCFSLVAFFHCCCCCSGTTLISWQ